MNDIIAAILARRSVRRFTADPVPEESVNLMLEAARHAPTAGNREPWFFLVVRNREIKEALARAAGQPFVASAPVCLVVCVEPERSALVYGRRGRNLYCYQDVAAATENILLAAVGLGLGACWVGAFDAAAASQALQLSPGLHPVALVPVGRPAGIPSGYTRRPLDEVVRFLP